MNMYVSLTVQRYMPDLEGYEKAYRDLHASPEVSLDEAETSAIVSNHLRSLGLETKTNIAGYGVVGILRNGTGKTVLLRAELDAIPLVEKTASSFAARKIVKDGHDIHVTSLLATMEFLLASREEWKGTVIALFQPGEENALGAKAMVEDGLFDPRRHNVPVPDVALAGHVVPMRAGLVKTRLGIIHASADNFKVTIYGRGGDAARPHHTVDPVIIACNVVSKLQQIISRHMDPLQPAVITVGSIHASAAPDMIADEAELLINMRAFAEPLRKFMIDLMTSFINTEAQSYSAPQTPLIEHTTHFPLLANDVTQTAIVARAMAQHFGHDFDVDAPISTDSEDFAVLSVPTPNVKVPIVFWNYGCVEPSVWDRAVEQNKLSETAGDDGPLFEPVLQPSLKVAVESQCVATLACLTAS